MTELHFFQNCWFCELFFLEIRLINQSKQKHSYISIHEESRSLRGVEIQNIATPAGLELQNDATPANLGIQNDAARANLEIQNDATPANLESRNISSAKHYSIDRFRALHKSLAINFLKEGDNELKKFESLTQSFHFGQFFRRKMWIPQ